MVGPTWMALIPTESPGRPEQRSARIAVLVRAEPQRRIGAAVAYRCSVQVDGRVGHRVVASVQITISRKLPLTRPAARGDHSVDLGVRVDVDDRAGLTWRPWSGRGGEFFGSMINMPTPPGPSRGCRRHGRARRCCRRTRPCTSGIG